MDVRVRLSMLVKPLVGTDTTKGDVTHFNLAAEVSTQISIMVQCKTTLICPLWEAIRCATLSAKTFEFHPKSLTTLKIGATLADFQTFYHKSWKYMDKTNLKDLSFTYQKNIVLFNSYFWTEYILAQCGMARALDSWHVDIQTKSGNLILFSSRLETYRFSIHLIYEQNFKVKIQMS